jgi:MFS family permease
MLNLWSPGHLSLLLVFPTALLLGMVHGVTPDEHTWPITFSYSVGSYSSRGGRRVGFLFSAAFTLQRAIASELAFLALSSFEFATRWQYEVYAVVGLVMALSGLYVLHRGHPLHWSAGRARAQEANPRSAPPYMPLVHGFIAGWGVGAFAVIIYTVLAPTMPNAWLGWVPGALFGIGTMIMQIILGSVFGAWMARRHLSPEAREYVARAMSGKTLTGGGLAFIAVAAIGIALPQWVGRLAVVTPIHVHNLHNLGAGFFLAVPALFLVAAWAFVSSRREAARRFAASPA